MMNQDWEDFFGIEEVYDMEEALADTYTGAKKDAVSALASCINAKGCVDMDWMMDVSGLELDELIETLEGAVYQDPKVYDRDHAKEQGWMLRAQYLSGNIKMKLETAKEMNKKYNGRFEANVNALKAAMPAKIDFEVIGFGIGSPWIPEKYYAVFAKEVLGLLSLPEIHYYAALGQWKITISPQARNAVQNIYTYGTKRLTALQIMETTLNGGNVKVYDEVTRPERKSGVARVLNKVETLAAQEKQEILQNAFQTWVRQDPSRVKRMKKIFYDTYACNVAGRYSGSFLDLPGLNTEQFTPHPHQKDAVARIILEKDVLLNHKVGTGKTGIIIMGIHEKKRMGLSDKNLVVVPNNVLEAFERTHRQLYPQDPILVVHPEDFKPDSRQAFLMKIKNGDYAAIYIAFSSFERLSMSKKYKLEQQRERIRLCRAQAANASESWERSRLETRETRLSEELMKMNEEIPADEFLAFDDLGITTLVVDEAHNFKNISIAAHTDSVVGMHVKGSKKCDEMLEKVQYVRNQGGSTIFATGTPLTNSISDLFVLQMYLQPEQLKMLHLDHFDEWINNFATRQTSFEIDVDSQNYRVRTRFASFHNIPELASLFSEVCDFYSNDDGGMGLPESEDYTDIIVEKSIEQEIYIDDLVERTEKIRQKHVRGTEDNMLKVTHDGRAAALDIRLAEPELEPDEHGTKVYACAEKVYELWKDYSDTAQLVFCDLGTPKKGFNIYDELKKHLQKMGVPDSQIAFVHDATTDARRRTLFESVNNASIRILIGSTSKLGTGVNVQERLVAVHHLDIPWKPSDIVQREGRLIRQGNSNDKVFRFRYITAGTFDAYSWQLLENKQRFISQFMSNHLVCRDARDIDDSVLTYAEIKALSVGDPLLKTRIDMSNELERLKIHRRQRAQELKMMESVVSSLPATLTKLEERKLRLEQDYQHYLESRENLSKEEREAFGEEVLEGLKENVLMETERWFDDLHGFRILLPAYMKFERPVLLIEGVSGNRYDVNMRDAKAGGCIQRMEYILSHLNERVQAVNEEIARVNAQAEHAKAEIKKGNSYIAEEALVSEKLMDIDEELNRRANEKEAA